MSHDSGVCRCPLCHYQLCTGRYLETSPLSEQVVPGHATSEHLGAAGAVSRGRTRRSGHTRAAAW